MYLRRPECGLASIDGDGRCSVAAYATSLLWWYLEANVAEDILLRAVEQSVLLDGIDALEAALGEKGTSLEAQWPGFAAWNLATGPRAAFPSDVGYWWAALLDGVQVTAEGESMDNTSRYESLSARYFRVDHRGGELWLTTFGPADPLLITVHPVASHEPDGLLAAMAGPYGLPSSGRLLLGEYAAGGIWLSISHPRADVDPIDVRIRVGEVPPTCASAPVFLWPCALAVGLVRIRARRARGRRPR